MTTAAQDRFAAIADDDDDQIDLAEAALVVASQWCAELSTRAALATLDALAQRARARDDENAALRQRVLALNDFLFGERGAAGDANAGEGFEGDREQYFDPRNSFLNEVLERRRGIPITLSILYITVARKLGMDAHGVSFPGHFLVRVEDPSAGEPIVVDPFGAQILDRPGCSELLRHSLGAGAEWKDEYLDPATPRQILQRLLTNLKQLYTQLGEHEHTLACCERLLLLTPDAPLELRDRGLVFHKLECFGPALADLERFLVQMPSHESAPAVRKLTDPLRLRVRTVH